MAALETAVDMMGRLTIANSTHCRGTQQGRTDLEKTNLTLIRVAEEMIENVEQFLRNPDASVFVDESLNILSRNATRLTAIIQSMEKAPEDLVIAHLFLLSKQNIKAQKLLSYFDKEFRAIIRRVLSSIGDDEPKFLRILEECYNQALDDLGVLYHDQYFMPLEEARLESPYDPDYQSEEYYEHENRIQVDEDYAEAERISQERMHSRERKHKQGIKIAWIDFWLQALQECPGGPTLFVPPETCDFDRLPDAPRYLFRAFDIESSGKSDDTVVASAASKYPNTEADRINILFLEQEQSSTKIHGHLTKDCFGGPHSDNLMSWSSSLLFVLQYAIWRSYRNGWSPARVRICAVDTSKFPKGQFARDMWLIRKCDDTSGQRSPMSDLIQLRRKEGYYNGEHLSQGIVNHTGRSCVFSLHSLINAGLYELYPEFNDPGGRKGWTNRVLALRSIWAVKSSTGQQDIRRAVQLAESCFPRMETLDIALMFLTFKSRKLQRTSDTRDEIRLRQTFYGIKEPAEIQRYINAIVRVKLQVRRDGLPMSETDILGLFFDST